MIKLRVGDVLARSPTAVAKFRGWLGGCLLTPSATREVGTQLEV